MVDNSISLGLLFAPHLDIVKEMCQEVFVPLQKPAFGALRTSQSPPARDDVKGEMKSITCFCTVANIKRGHCKHVT